MTGEHVSNNRTLMWLACPRNYGIVWRKAEWCWAFSTGTDWDRYRRYFCTRPSSKQAAAVTTIDNQSQHYARTSLLAVYLCSSAQVPVQCIGAFRRIEDVQAWRDCLHWRQLQHDAPSCDHSLDRSTTRSNGAISGSSQTPFTTRVSLALPSSVLHCVYGDVHCFTKHSRLYRCFSHSLSYTVEIDAYLLSEKDNQKSI